jgi:hypothetical protein
MNTLSVRVGAVGSLTASPVKNEPDVIELPPLESQVTVFVFALHCACNVNPDVNVTDAPFAYTTEPPELVAHPAKV